MSHKPAHNDELQLYVLLRYPTLSETFVSSEIQGLRRCEIDVDVISLEPGDSNKIDDKRAGPSRSLERPSRLRALRDHLWFGLRWPLAYLRFVGAVLRLREYSRVAGLLPTEARRLREARRVDGCHTHFAWASASVAVYLAALLDVPVSITVHANDIYVGDARRLRRRLREFDRVVTVCNFNVGLLSGLGITQVGGGDIDVVPCGVVVPDQSASPEESEVDLISVARLVEKKGCDTLIRAVGLARRYFPDISLTIVGDGPERAALSRLIQSLRLEENVKVAGAMTHEDALRLMATAKVFCLASQRASNGDCDAVPVVLREAMARATPVISTRVAGIPETVDTEVGWVVDPESPEQLAEAIRAALSNEPERHRRGVAAYTRVRQRWTVDDQVSALKSSFRSRDAVFKKSSVRTPPNARFADDSA